MKPQEREDEVYTPADLGGLRLAQLPWVAVPLYVGAVALTFVPLTSTWGDSIWLGIGVAVLVLFAMVNSRARPLLGAGILIVGLLAAWGVALAVYPWPVAVGSLTILVVGVTSALFGPPGALLIAGGTTLVLIFAGGSLGLPGELKLEGVLASWLAAYLFWLTARPIAGPLAWAWSSYREAREKRDELRRQHAELSRVVKSLDLAYLRLEQLTEELNRARHASDEARRLKSEFAASISHEIRTPLNLIIGFSEMMELAPHTYGVESLPAAYRADVDAIYRNAQHLAGLVDDVLDLSQIEGGRMALLRQPASLAAVIEEAVSAVNVRFASLGLALDVDVPPDLPFLTIDRTRIRQILINLLNNAARFTDRGGVRIGAERRANEIVVSVSDTGIGIAPDELPRVFEEFHQAGGAVERRVGGSGLGLTISKKLVELHGGAMWATSTVGVGSTFAFSLPVTGNVIVGSTAGAEALWDRVTASSRAAEPGVVVVSSNPDTVRTFQRYLDGYRVVAVDNVAQVADVAKGTATRGMVLPVASAEAAWQALYRTIDLPGDLPIAVCAMHDPSHRSADLGVATYLSKPVTRAQVEDVLHHLGKKVRTILVVDDNADMVRLLAKTITNANRRYRVWRATSGEEALAIMGERRPDAVVLDLLMPGTDGYAVLDVMRRQERLCDVPVVVISARGATPESPAPVLLGLGRTGGLTTGEMMRCLTSCFDLLRPDPARHNGSAPRGDPREGWAWAGAPRLRESH